MKFYKTFNRWKKNSLKGFTLVELMVVVAIIGILSAIAIPNFMRYQAKAKTSEAKLALASVYSLESGVMADFNSYASCLDFMGYAGPTANSAYYTVGFNSSLAAASAAMSAITSSGGLGCTTATAFVFPANKTVNGGSALTSTVPVAYVVNAAGTSFIAGASGVISSTGTDIWGMDQNKKLIQSSAGY